MQVKEIDDRLRMELLEWFRKQCNNLSNYYYLYYIESTSSHNGGFIICESPPANPEYKLASDKHIAKHCTRSQNFSWLRQVINQLPIIEG